MIVPFTHQHVVLQVVDQCCLLEGIAVDLCSTVVPIRHILRRIGRGFSNGELIRIIDLPPPTFGQNLQLEVPHALH